jgi:uncharacterized protein YerC
MTQVSKIPLRKEVEKRVYEILMISIAQAKASDTVQKLLDDLLSPTERLMLAKRLAIALLLLKKYDQRVISRWLKVSLTTVSKVSLTLQTGKGGYQLIIGSMVRKEELHAFLRKIDDALADLLPPAGRNWSNWRRARWQEKIERQKPF